MIIRPSAAIRQHYNDIAALCRSSKEPVFLTKNGEGDLVVMDIDTYNRHLDRLKLWEELLASQEEVLQGENGYSVDETIAMMEKIAHGSSDPEEDIRAAE